MIQRRVSVLTVSLLILFPSTAFGQRIQNRFERPVEQVSHLQEIAADSYWIEGAVFSGVLGALVGAGFGLVAACIVNDGNCDPGPTVMQFSIGGAALGGLLGGAIGSVVRKQDHGA